MYIMEYDSKATLGDLPDRYVYVLGGQFYDEYNVTSNVTGLVPDPDGPIKNADGNFSVGLVEQNVRIPPQWSLIMRPPTDETCFSQAGNDDSTLISDGICPAVPRRESIQKAIGDSRGYPQVAQPGLEQLSSFCVYGWARGEDGRCTRAYAFAEEIGPFLWRGEVTDAERQLGCFVDDPRDRSDDEVKWWPDRAVVCALAALWAADPSTIGGADESSAGLVGRC